MKTIRDCLPCACALPAFYAGLRRRGHTQSGFLAWYECLKRPNPGMAAEIQGRRKIPGSSRNGSLRRSQSDVLVYVRVNDASRRFSTICVYPPSTGCTPDGQINWSVARQWALLEGFSTSVGAWLEWLQEQVRPILEELALQPVDWHVEEAVIQPPDWADTFGEQACLTIEYPDGATWRLTGSSDVFNQLWTSQAAQAPASQTEYGRLVQRLSDERVVLDFMLEIPRLSRTQMASLHTGCLLKLDTVIDGTSFRLRLVACSPAERTRVAMHASVRLMMHVRPGNDRHEIAFEWKYLMTDMPPDPSPDSHEDLAGLQPLDALEGELRCVIGTRRFSLADLLRLRAGDLIPLHDFPLPHVDLMIGERRLGTGELVSVGNTLAVQLVEWLPDQSSDAGDVPHE